MSSPLLFFLFSLCCPRGRRADRQRIIVPSSSFFFVSVLSMLCDPCVGGGASREHRGANEALGMPAGGEEPGAATGESRRRRRARAAPTGPATPAWARQLEATVADDTMSDLSPVTLDRISVPHTLFVKKKKKKKAHT